MTAEEKFNSCKHRPDEQIEIFEGCPCKKKKKLVYQCIKRSIMDVKPEICANCALFENKNS
jgi:hypothetical protein